MTGSQNPLWHLYGAQHHPLRLATNKALIFYFISLQRVARLHEEPFKFTHVVFTDKISYNPNLEKGTLVLASTIETYMDLYPKSIYLAV
jgi:hypothetical protein